MAIQSHFFADNACRGGNVDGGVWFLQRQQLQQPSNIQSLCFEDNEINQFIISQNERLRLLLQEQRKQQIAVLLKQTESKASILLNQRDEEIQKARNKTMELQNLLKKLEMDNYAWQKVALERQAMVVSLNNKLERLGAVNNGIDDAESWCEIEDQQDEERRRKTAKVCKCCDSRSVCVLFLPCRHLCSCKECEAFLDSCPVCGTEKKDSIEALIS